MENVFEVRTMDQAKELLAAKGVVYDRVCMGTIRETSRYTGLTTRRDGIHVYFMLGGSDVAYLTPIMGTLRIWDEPRPWDKELLDSLRDLGPHEATFYAGTVAAGVWGY